MRGIIPVRAISIAIAMAAMPGLAGAQLVRDFAGRAVTRSPSQIGYVYVQHLKTLRTQMLAQQKIDGGTLTDVHKAAFQDQLDRLNAQYKRTVVNHDPLTVDASGHPVRDDPARNWTYSKPILTGIVN